MKQNTKNLKYKTKDESSRSFFVYSYPVGFSPELRCFHRLRGTFFLGGNYGSQDQYTLNPQAIGYPEKLKKSW